MMVEYPFRKGQASNKLGREDEYIMARMASVYASNSDTSESEVGGRTLARARARPATGPWWPLVPWSGAKSGEQIIANYLVAFRASTYRFRTVHEVRQSKAFNDSKIVWDSYVFN